MTTPTRRRLVIVGGVAGAAGVGFALWRSGPATAPDAADAAVAGAGADLWTMSFPQPDGAALALARFRGRPLLVNFWATWCPPCIREMPEIDRFARQFGPNGWQVLGLAADQDKPVREFLNRNPVSYPIALVGFEGIALSRALGNGAGALPYTVAFDATGMLVHRHLGETRFELLAGWAAGRAGRSTPP